MAYNLKSEEDVKLYLTNLGTEYRFGCYSEKNPEVCHLLGDYLESIDKDFQKAGRVYRSNCDDYKYPKSCYKFATYALLGKGVKKPDFPEAYKYFEKGCNLDNPEACLHQGLLLITHNDNNGISKDVLKGMQLLEKACLAQNGNACYYLSGMYIAGVRKPGNQLKEDSQNEDVYEVKKDMKKAFRYTEEGCNLGNIYSCANLSQMYAKGDGVEKNETLAEKFKKKALEMQDEMNTQKTLTFEEGLRNK